jgi:hypothetical protein
MKKFIVLYFIVLAVCVPVYVAASSCESGEDFYIKCTMDGQEYMLTYGREDISKDAPFAVLYTDMERRSIFISGSNVSSDEGIESLEMGIMITGELRPDNVGEYIGDYTLVTSNGITSTNAGEGIFQIIILVVDVDDTYIYESTGGIATITSFGDVDGVVIGTFNVNLEGGLFSAALGESTLDITGEFRLFRISENDLPGE